MTIALVAIRDGRDQVHAEAVASLEQHVDLSGFDQRITIDDHDHQLGFAGAIQAAWQQVDCDYVFHVELDFLFNERVDLDEMIDLLDRHPELAQVALKRQPWNPNEIAAGGIIEQHPDDYTERSDAYATWTEHRRFFTTNPSVYPRRIVRVGWPQVPESEGIFTHTLLRDPHLRFAFWGAKHDPPRVHHIGQVRAGVGY